MTCACELRQKGSNVNLGRSVGRGKRCNKRMFLMLLSIYCQILKYTLRVPGKRISLYFGTKELCSRD